MEENETLAEVTTDKILRYLEERQLQVGNKLPNEYELSDYLGVGRDTVREAVRALVSRNILEVRQGAGTSVSDKRGVINDPLGFFLIEDRDRMIRSLFELRYLLKPKVAGLATEYATKSQISQMKSLTQEVETSFREGIQNHVQLNTDFHTAITETSRNVALLHIIPIINESIALFNKNYDIQHSKIETIDIHTEIVQTIERRSVPTTFDAMTVHTAIGRKELQEMVGKKETD